MNGQDVRPDWLRSGATNVAFAPRPLGFGAALLGLPLSRVRYDAETLVRSVRKEAELLRPAVTLLGADVTALAESLGATVAPTDDGSWAITGGSLPDRGEWAALELPDLEASSAFSVSLAAARALADVTRTGMVLPGPAALAAQLYGGSSPECDDDWEDLVDGCALVVTDAVKRVVAEAACSVVLHDRAIGGSHVIDELYVPLVRVLRHSGLACAVIVEGGDDDWLDALRRVEVLSTVVAVGEADACVRRGCGAAPADSLWSGTPEVFEDRLERELAALETARRGEPVVYAPSVPATASPERVQQLTRRLARGS